jgi:hypothetical protein
MIGFFFQRKKNDSVRMLYVLYSKKNIPPFNTLNPTSNSAVDLFHYNYK